MNVVDEILGIFSQRGADAYYGEHVSMTEHMLQAAYFAHAAGAPPPLIVAALLHDIGHLVAEVPDDLQEWTHDVRHEEVGGAWLSGRFPPQVCEPVRLHVPAKRFLCATEAGYQSCLSAASIVTLNLQGGPMSSAEAASFESRPHYRAAVELRRWDDRGKVAGLLTPDLESYRALLARVAGSGS